MRTFVLYAYYNPNPVSGSCQSGALCGLGSYSNAIF